MLKEAELAEVFHRYGYFVRRRCRALVDQDAEADDAMQEVFLRVQKYGLPREERATLGWLYRIAGNVIHDQRRSKREQPATQDESARAEKRAPSAIADEPDLRAVVGGVLRGLDARTREIVVRHHLEGLTQDEIAQEMKTSRRTIGKRLADFEARLRLAWTGKETP